MGRRRAGARGAGARCTTAACLPAATNNTNRSLTCGRQHAAGVGADGAAGLAGAAAAGQEDLFAARLEAAFKLLDKNGDGTLTRGELNTALKKCEAHAHSDGDSLGHEDVRKVLGISAMRTDEDRRQFELVYQQLDGDDDKRITMEEFRAYFESTGLPRALNQEVSTATKTAAAAGNGGDARLAAWVRRALATGGGGEGGGGAMLPEVLAGLAAAGVRRGALHSQRPSRVILKPPARASDGGATP